MRKLLSLAWAFVTVALTACDGQQTIPSQTGLNTQQAIFHPNIVTGDLESAARNPCAIKGLWHFGGTCIRQRVEQTQAMFSLAAYEGIAAKISFGTDRSKATKSSFLTVGDANGKNDITGTVHGVAFPLLTRQNCVPTGSARQCYGKAVLYIIEINTGATTISYAQSPAIDLASKTLRKPSVCNLDNLQAGSQGLFWGAFPIRGAAASGRVRLPAEQISATFPPKTFSLWVVTCT